MKTIYEDIMTQQPRYETYGECLFWMYAIWQTIFATARMGEETFGKKFYMYRQIFFNKFKSGKQHITDLYHLNKIKVQQNDFCYYCYEELPSEELTADHVFPRAKGGTNSMDNIIFVCKNCNSSKGKKDMLEWFLLNKGEFPSPFVLGHYMRQIYFYAVENNLMDKSYEDVCQMQLPFNPRCIMFLTNKRVRDHYMQRANYEISNDYEDYRE